MGHDVQSWPYAPALLKSASQADRNILRFEIALQPFHTELATKAAGLGWYGPHRWCLKPIKKHFKDHPEIRHEPISFFFFQKNRKSSRPDPLMIGRHNQRDAGRPRRSRFGGQIALFQLVCRSLSVSLLRIFLIRGQQVQTFLKEHSK